MTVTTVSEGLQPRLIVGTSEMADRIRNHPWHQTPLGAIADWPTTLLDNVNLILNASVALAIYWGPQMIFLQNDESNRMIGRRDVDPLGLGAAQVWGANWHKMQSRFTAVLESGVSSSSQDFPIRKVKEGVAGQVFVDFSLGPIYHRGEVVGIFRALLETTNSVLAMQALAEANERLQMALSAGNGLGVWDWHIQTGKVYGDESLAKLYNLDPQAVAAGVSHLQLERMLHPDDIKTLSDAVMLSISTGEQYSVRYRVQRVDGSYRWVQSNGRCIFDDNGHACRVTGTKTEIADQPVPLPQSHANGLFTDAQLILLPAAIRSFLAGTVFLLADFQEGMKLDVIPEANATRLVLHVAPELMGRIIGKQGRTIRAVRTLLLSMNGASAHRYSIDVLGEVMGSEFVN